MPSTLLYFYTESPLHVGIGASVAAIDQPIQRERTTFYPVVPGSGIKGALRSHFDLEDVTATAVFGPPPGENEPDQAAGCLAVGAAHILLFPVRSVLGIFAYITCPDVLARYGRELARAEWNLGITLPTPSMEQAYVGANCVVADLRVRTPQLVLEEFAFSAVADERVQQLGESIATNALPASDEYAYWRDKIQSSLVIVADDVFRDFVTHSTEISTHIRIEPFNKTVENGALWTTESLPADTLLFSTITANQVRTEALGELASDKPESVFAWISDRNRIPVRMHLGGDETTGQGLVAKHWHGSED